MANKRGGKSRPKLDERGRVMLSFRPEDLEELEALAAAEMLPPSTYMRQILLKHAQEKRLA